MTIEQQLVKLNAARQRTDVAIQKLVRAYEQQLLAWREVELAWKAQHGELQLLIDLYDSELKRRQAH